MSLQPTLHVTQVWWFVWICLDNIDVRESVSSFCSSREISHEVEFDIKDLEFDLHAWCVEREFGVYSQRSFVTVRPFVLKPCYGNLRGRLHRSGALCHYRIPQLLYE